MSFAPGTASFVLRVAPPFSLLVALIHASLAAEENRNNTAASTTRAARPAPQMPAPPTLPPGALVPPPGDLRARDGEHPLLPLIRWAERGLESLEAIDDYSCVLIKRERVRGTLQPEESLFIKVRHRPFSVYGQFISPPPKRGRAFIYVEGRNGGRLWAHAREGRDRFAGTVSLWPDGRMAMKDNRYPVTEVGIVNLIARLVEIGQQEMAIDDCRLTQRPGAKINGRPCVLLDIRHERREAKMRFHIARLYIDNKTNLPVRYESYGWPREPGGPVPLVEEYTYLDVQVNRGFTDRDFDIANPEYGFPPEVEPSEDDVRRALDDG